jgi:hypothetical protein
MEKFEDKATGFTTKVTNDKLILEMPIANLVRGFNNSPDNYDGSNALAKIKREMRREFAIYLAENLFDESDQDTGENYIEKMLDQLFIRALENDEDFLQYQYPEDEE